MKRLLLELGGKGAALVFDDADLRTAIDDRSASVWAFHSGQICTAPTRVLAQRGVYDQLVAALQAAASLKVGDPLEEGTVLGPVICGGPSRPHRVVHRRRCRRGWHESSPVASARPGDGVLRRADAARRLQGRHEGGAGGDLRAGGRGRAVRRRGRAWRSPTAPSSACTTTCSRRTAARAMRVAEQLRSGNVGINTPQRNHEAPFGGFRQSGVGRDGGSFGLHAYSELQSITWPG